MSKITIPKVEFYITNVCNLTCEYCNRFNNFYFKGWQNWQDYRHIYQQWAQLLDIKQPVIMGGEPLLNPTVCDWAEQISLLFNNAVQIVSNGTRINYVPKLYETMLRCRVWISITIHNIDEIEQIMEEVENFLTSPVKKIQGAENNKFGAPYCYIDANNVSIPFYITNDFLQSAILKDSDGNLTLHHSNPKHAHDICVFAQAKCYHFIGGKFYKCGPVALLPEFDRQFALKISDEDRVLLNSYQPLTLENFEYYSEEFFSKLDDPIDQCKFCPSYGGGGKIWPVRKNTQL